MLEKIRIQYQAFKILRTKDLTLFPKKFLLYLFIKSQHEKLSLHEGRFVISSDLPPFPSGAFDRLIDAIHSTREQEVIPIYATFSITNKCMYNCWHCYINSLKEEDMCTEDAIKILYQLQELGTSVIAFTGGEPLLRNDICEIISKIDADKSSVVLFTTGYGLTKKKAEELKQAGLFGVIIGLEHTDKKIEDKLRNYDGSYERALEGIKNAKNSGLYVSVSTVATKERITTGEIWDFIKFAGKQGADEVHILEPITVGKIIDEDEVILTNKERKQLVHIQKKVNRKNRYLRVLSYPYRESKQLIGCCAGYQYIHVTASGNICPCSFTPLLFGNVKNEELSVIWRRMNTVFNTPGADCFMIKNHKYISKYLDDGFITPEKSVQICSSCRIHNVPQFYKKLGVK
jgi:MoaA/NifB/PqqE/SkfB family radical SAM enzyme